ncbi:KUP/HAK/KT family potassium transporter [Streptomyces iakyrus]
MAIAATPDDEPTAPPPESQGRGPRDAVRLAVVIGALGVVFGDIGTSPIYTLQTVFNPSDPHPVPVSAENVYGVVSLV